MNTGKHENVGIYMRKYLDEALAEYSRSDYYPFHMPGHKRQRLGDFVPEEIDVTEIDGFDDLHHAEGILKEGQERLAALFGADESFYLINGSTAGILAAVCGCMKKGGRLLIGRNCHKSVYHAAYLMEARLEYLYPEPTAFGIQGSVAPEQVKERLNSLSDIQAVVVTSPTYDGVVSDIAAIAAIVHAYGIPLIVDGAHGAHFGFSELFPQKAIALGADLCVESLHKTLPACTQSAALHMKRTAPAFVTDACPAPVSEVNRKEKTAEPVRGYRFEPERVRRYLDIFQSSSPSYVLMAGMDRCVRLLEADVKKYRCGNQRGSSRFGAFEEKLRRFYDNCGDFQRVRVFPSAYFSRTEDGCPCNPVKEGRVNPDFGRKRTEGTDETTGIFVRDPSKILISAEAAGFSGQQLYELLLEKYHLQMEMASGHYVCAITTIMDTEEGFRRLFTALREIDREAGNRAAERLGSITPPELYLPQRKVMEIAQATDAEKTPVPLREAEGRVSGAFLYLYPPGIPILVPGEEITKEVMEIIRDCTERGLRVQGLPGYSYTLKQAASAVMTIRLDSVDMEFVKDASSPSPPHRAINPGDMDPIGQNSRSTTILRISGENGRT